MMLSRLALLLALFLLATPASADEPPPPGDFPPPEDAPKAPEPEAPEAPPAEGPGDPDWSAPSAPTTRTKTAPPVNTALPPPRVVHRTRGRSLPVAPNAARTTAPAATPPATPPAIDPWIPADERFGSPDGIRDVPARGPGVRPRTPSFTPTPMDARSAGVRRATASPPGRGESVVRGCRILAIRKTHNVEGPDIEAQGLDLQIDVDYEVRGQQGRDVYVGIWFARRTDGVLVKSVLPRYADIAGNTTLQTRWTRVAGPSVRYAATLRIPYSTFPVPAKGESYEIEARVQILRTERDRRVSLLARDSTRFRVYGIPEAERPLPAEPELDTAGMAAPGETGEILDPGERPEGSGVEATPGETGVIEDVPEVPETPKGPADK